MGGRHFDVQVGVVAGVVALALFGTGGTALAQSPTGISVVDGKTAAVFDLRPGDPRARLHPNGLDGDRDRMEDSTAIEIMRPKESGPDLKVPAMLHFPEPLLLAGLRPVSSASASATSTATTSTTSGRSGAATTSCRAATR